LKKTKNGERTKSGKKKSGKRKNGKFKLKSKFDDFSLTHTCLTMFCTF